jgi:hypothetical protein
MAKQDGRQIGAKTRAKGPGRLIRRKASPGGKGAATAATDRVEAVMAAAARSGLLRDKSGRIGGRVSPVLVERAKARTGISADTDLVEFALANLALEDKFAESFKAVRGTVDPDLELGF